MAKRKKTTKITVFLSERIIAECSRAHLLDNCDSRSEFIEKAIDFYLGYLAIGKNPEYAGEMLTVILDGKLSQLANQFGKFMNKLAVEIQALLYLFGDQIGADQNKIDLAIKIAEQDVKEINGIINLKEIINKSREVK